MTQTVLFNEQNNTCLKIPRLSPIIKWAGGKELELTLIAPKIPVKFNRYYDPFVGGGAVYFSIDRPEMFINDKSEELISIYRLLKDQDPYFFEQLEKINNNWKLLEKVVISHYNELISLYKNYSLDVFSKIQTENAILEFVIQNAEEFNGILESSFNISIENFIREVKRNLINKIGRMKKIEIEKGNLSQEDILNNIESALKSAFYMHFRYLYNRTNLYNIEPSFASAIFFFIREFCYASMFRYNQKGEFNVPYGGIQYNRKDFLRKIQTLHSKDYQMHLSKTKIFNCDFLDFLTITTPQDKDFIFLDPPYDSEFSTYANNTFTREDQIRLAQYLYTCPAYFMLVIKNTEFIYELYTNRDLRIESFDKKYLVSFQDRNDKRAEHLIITNY